MLHDWKMEFGCYFLSIRHLCVRFGDIKDMVVYSALNELSLQNIF